MSFKAFVWAKDLSLPPRDKYVLLILCDYYNDDSGAAWMKQGTLAEVTGFSRQTVNAALTALETTHGLIRSEHRSYPDGRIASKIYRINWASHRVNEIDTGASLVNGVDTDLVNGVDNMNSQHRTHNIELTKEHVVSAKSEASPGEALAATPPRAIDVDSFLEVWNENRGNLPQVTVANRKRKAAVAAIVKEHGADTALALLRDAARAVAADDFWTSRQYGFDNLLAGNKLVARAEQWRAGAAKLGAGNLKLATNVQRWAKALPQEEQRGR